MSVLTPQQPTLAFITDLLGAAFALGEGRDTLLRNLLLQVQSSSSLHTEQQALLATLLQQDNLASALFSTGQAEWRLQPARFGFTRIYPTQPPRIPHGHDIVIRLLIATMLLICLLALIVQWASLS